VTRNQTKVLVVDIGGTNVKLLAIGHRTPVKIPSGPKMTPKKMVAAVLETAAKWKYSRVSIGYPGPVLHGKPVSDPHNLGPGWVGFDFQKAFGRPVKLVNDAAMQAIGSYQGRRMLFLGLGTGLGSALIVDGVLQPMELAHLPYKNGRTYEDYIGLHGLECDLNHNLAVWKGYGLSGGFLRRPAANDAPVGAHALSIHGCKN
jgi:predicted NBD/HSP70 family sugar kinase